MIYIYGQLETYSSHEHVHPHTDTVHTVQLHSTYQKVDACCPPGWRKRVRRAVKYDEHTKSIVNWNTHNLSLYQLLHTPIQKTYYRENNIVMDDMKQGQYFEGKG